MPPSEIRKEARASLKGNWRKAISITLVFFAISSIFGFAQGFFEEDSIIYNILDLVFLVISIPLSFGLTIAFMQFKRGENVGVFSFIKEGFSRLNKAWGIWLHTLLKLLLPVICLILVSALMFSLGLVNALTESNLALTLLGIALFIATVIYVACRGLLYVIAYNISYDNPELSSKECVKKSEELMKGNRGNYILLELSFIGWVLLLVFAFSLGTSLLVTLLGYWGFLIGYAFMIIGMLFLMPYMQIATVCFYERVINNKKVEE